MRTDFFKVSFALFITFLLLFAPAFLMQKLFSNIFISGIVNGLSQFATLPFLPYMNKKISRRKGLMTTFGLNAIFTLLQFILNPSGCLNCTKKLTSVFVLVFFFTARFFINLNSNFFINTLNETFPAQIRSICYIGVVEMGRFSSLMIPYIPKLKQWLSLSYDLIFVFAGLLGVLASFILR